MTKKIEKKIEKQETIKKIKKNQKPKEKIQAVKKVASKESIKKVEKIDKQVKKVEKIDIKKENKKPKIDNKKIKVENKKEQAEKKETKVTNKKEVKLSNKKLITDKNEIKSEVKNEKIVKKKIKTNDKKEKIEKKNEKLDNKSKIIKKKKSGVLKCTKQHVTKCVDALLLLASKQEDKKSLLSDFEKPIYLQITAFKIPKTPRRTVRVYLPHSLVGEDDEVALFVPDLVKGIRQDYEKSVDHYQQILRQHNVTSIKEVIPMNRVKTEYRQHESRAKLARLFDHFLVDGRITGHLTHLLGSKFHKIGRKPIPIKMSRDNLKNEIDNALKKTNLEINGFGNTHTVEIASATMKNTDIVDNVLATFEEIKKSYPGGLTNVKSILIKTKNSKSIPVYYSMANKNKIPVPEIKPLRPKQSTAKPTTTEQSTPAKN